jgi:putative lipoic acid-binding regulatory protein
MDEQKPVIDFPCDDYPIKVIASHNATLLQSVVEIMREHDATFQAGCVEERPSSKGNYVSVRVRIRATGEPQLQALHKDLMALPSVKMVL